MSKVLQNAPREHSAIFSTFIKLSLVFKTVVMSILNGHLRQVLMYLMDVSSKGQGESVQACLSFHCWTS